MILQHLAISLDKKYYLKMFTMKSVKKLFSCLQPRLAALCDLTIGKYPQVFEKCIKNEKCINTYYLTTWGHVDIVHSVTIMVK